MPPIRSRRDVFRYAAAGVAMLNVPGVALSQETPNPGPKPDTPEAALQALLDGNARYLKQDFLSFKEDLAILRGHTEEKQEPFAALLSCADSRVPVELVFDQSIGHLFVVRVAGNIATSDTIASLEYGAAVLGTKAILVLGHTNCGAVKATMAGKAVPGQISTLYPYIYPAIAGESSDLASVTRRNAQLQASLLREASPVLHELVAGHKLLIRAAIYDVGTGKVSILES